MSDNCITLAVTGDPGKTRALQRTINKFGVVSVARTGKLALKRETAYNEERRTRMIAMLAQRAASSRRAVEAHDHRIGRTLETD